MWPYQRGCLACAWLLGPQQHVSACPVPFQPAPRRQAPRLVEAAQAHLERLEGQRKLFLAARALMLAQRMLL